jgi:hypothetical protein
MVKTRRSKGTKGRGVVSRVYSPLHHLFRATGETVGVVTNTARNIVKRSIKAVNNVGSSFTKHADMTIKNVTSRKRKNATRKQQRRQNAARKH